MYQTYLLSINRLIRNSNKSKKTGTLSVPSDPRIRKSFDLDSDIESDLDGGGAIYRSSSCFELSERMIVRVTIKGHREKTCPYKSIYVSLSHHININRTQ